MVARTDGPPPVTERAAALDAAELPESGMAFEMEPGKSLGYLVRDTNRLLSRALAAEIAIAGVGIGQWYFLRILWEEDGLTQRELSQRVGMMEPTTVTALNGMEKTGLISRVRNTDDRRKVNVYLTDKGRALKAQLLPRAAEVNARAAADLTPDEIDMLRRLLTKVKARLAQGEA